VSLIVTVCTNEGIVMASDSKSTYTNMTKSGDKTILSHGIHTTDTTYKTFLCGGKTGISTCGNGNVGGRSITGHVESFIENVYDEADGVGETADKLLEYFEPFPYPVPIAFFVAGYVKDPHGDSFQLYKVSPGNRKKTLIRNNVCGANWDGETAILSRIMKNGYLVPENEVIHDLPTEGLPPVQKNLLDKRMVIPKSSVRHPDLEMAWNLMTLQDGIDFAVFAIRTTIDTMRFQMCVKTVGGPIDVLVIKPSGAQWISRKELRA
jgi:20S proteasome alpha/beta subunit